MNEKNTNKPAKLDKSLGLFSVYAIGTGTTLSAGFFLLPGMAAQGAGPAMVLAYILATIPLIPAMFSIVELCTAMPKAGGVYYFLDRSLGPLFGTIGGLGTWLALILKVSFALVGMGYYIAMFNPDLVEHIKLIGVGLAVVLGILNYFGSKKSGSFQTYLVLGLVAILSVFIFGGAPQINLDHFNDFFQEGAESIIATAGLVYISYVGVTSVASLSEEVKDPEKNLPRGIFLSLGTALVVYVIGTSVMIGTLELDALKSTMTPVADSAKIIFGETGGLILAVAALIAFVSVANAGTMSASRYPLAMSRDKIFPAIFSKITSKGTPAISLLLTVAIIVGIVLFLDPLKIAKLASAFQLLMFALICFTVIVMRESGLDSYDPGYKSPFYPWIQIVGIIAPIWLITEMGWLPTTFSIGLVFVGIMWYFYYAKEHVDRAGAIFHVFEKLGHNRHEALDQELRGIMKEKGLRAQDPFDEIIARSTIIDIDGHEEFETVVAQVSPILSAFVPETDEEIAAHLLDGTRIGATPVTHGVALPHFRSEGIAHAEMVLVRAKQGVNITLDTTSSQNKSVFALIFLVSPLDQPTQHLRILAQIAGHVDDDYFQKKWMRAKTEQQLKEVLLRDERSISLTVRSHSKTSILINEKLLKVNFPENSLVALLNRKGKVIVPRGNITFKEKDRLTIIGDPEAIEKIRAIYG
ncbi:MAG: amino acid permease [Fibrobacterales bacterium]